MFGSYHAKQTAAWLSSKKNASQKEIQKRSDMIGPLMIVVLVAVTLVIIITVGFYILFIQ